MFPLSWRPKNFRWHVMLHNPQYFRANRNQRYPLSNTFRWKREKYCAANDFKKTVTVTAETNHPFRYPRPPNWRSTYHADREEKRSVNQMLFLDLNPDNFFTFPPAFGLNPLWLISNRCSQHTSRYSDFEFWNFHQHEKLCGIKI